MAERNGSRDAMVDFLYETANWLENQEDQDRSPGGSAQDSARAARTAVTKSADPAGKDRPSRERVSDCLRSASHWVSVLPTYADSQQKKADWFAIIAGIVAVVTGASIYPVVENVTNEAARYLLAAPALLAAVLSVIPQVKNYGEMAGRARELSSSYGDMTGRLRDAVTNYDVTDPATLKAVLDDFGTLKAKKDQLRDLPPRLA